MNDGDLRLLPLQLGVLAAPVSALTSFAAPATDRLLVNDYVIDHRNRPHSQDPMGINVQPWGDVATVRLPSNATLYKQVSLESKP